LLLQKLFLFSGFVFSHSSAAVVLLYHIVSGMMRDASLKASSSPWKTCYHQCGVFSVAVTV
jgi:uncharacterized surface protein with fasciclin (FAS1) repeats